MLKSWSLDMITKGMNTNRRDVMLVLRAGWLQCKGGDVAWRPEAEARKVGGTPGEGGTLKPSEEHVKEELVVSCGKWVK